MAEENSEYLNLKVKYRESFRPFAPSILKEDLEEWFDINVDSPYMLMVANINKIQSKLFTTENGIQINIDEITQKLLKNSRKNQV